jgi:hypothetical protein
MTTVEGCVVEAEDNEREENEVIFINDFENVIQKIHSMQSGTEKKQKRKFGK